MENKQVFESLGGVALCSPKKWHRSDTQYALLKKQKCGGLYHFNCAKKIKTFVKCQFLPTSQLTNII